MDSFVPNCVFVIDTTHYAGNFVRELSAYVLGHVGYHEDLENIVIIIEKFIAEHLEEFTIFDDNLYYRRDEYGNPIPYEILETPGFYNDGMGNSYTENDSVDFVNNRYIESVEKYCQPYIEKITKEIENGTPELISELDSYKKRIEDAKINGAGRAPAYQSVAFFFNEEPDSELIQFMKNRAEKFSKTEGEWRSTFNIIGYRLIQNILTSVEKDV